MRTLKALVLALPSLTLVAGNIGAGVVLATALSAPAYAAEKAPAVSAKVGKPLKEAQELAQAKKFKEALAKVKEAEAVPGKTPFEENTVAEFMAYVSMNLGDYAGAAKAYESTLDSAQPQQQKDRLKTIAQLYYQAQNYSKAAEFGSRYLKEAGANLDVGQLIAQSYYIQKDYNKTVAAVQSLMQMAKQAQAKVKENWLQLLLSSYHELGKEDGVANTLEQLLINYPSQAYWADMMRYVQNRTNVSDREKLEIYRLKLATNTLAERDYVDMAELSLANALPGDAKMILEKGLGAGTIGAGANKGRETRLLDLARTQSASDIKTLDAQDKEASAEPTGEADAKVGEAMLSYGYYDKAIQTISRAIKKGKLKSLDEAKIHLGLAYYYNQHNAEAVAAMQSVPEQSRYARIARLWTIQIQGAKK